MTWLEIGTKDDFFGDRLGRSVGNSEGALIVSCYGILMG